jgi:hypothetical protein
MRWADFSAQQDIGLLATTLWVTGVASEGFLTSSRIGQEAGMVPGIQRQAKA